MDQHTIAFDSSWELALWIFCIDNGIAVSKADAHFTYTCNGKDHLYFPDLKVNNEFVEIKGDQFFDESGKMKCPFRYDNWTDEKYAEVCAVYEAKYKCMIDNNIKILCLKDIAPALEYVKHAYGKTHLKQFQIKHISSKKTNTTIK